jgi:hypothetical protein
MEGIVELDTLAELSLTLAGFSALLAVFRGGDIHSWNPRARLGFWLIITYSLGALFFSLLPSILRDVGASSWESPILALLIFLTAIGVVILRRNLQLVSAGVPAPNQTIWVLGTVVVLATVATLGWSLVGGLGGPSYRLYHLGVVVCLLLACLCFVNVLRFREPAG